MVVERVKIPARRASCPALSLSLSLSQDGFCLRHAAVYRRVLTGCFQIPRAALIFKKRWPGPGLSRLGILNWQEC